jgi:hypothetical protein
LTARDARYAREQFSAAVRILAESRGRIKERLLDAYRLQVIPAIPAQAGLSPGVRQRLTDLERRMTGTSPADDDDKVAARIAAMSENEAVEVAREIVYLAWEITNEVAGLGA